MRRILGYINILTLIPVVLYAYPEGWSDDELLTPETPGYRLDPDISVDSYKNVWVVWDSNFWGSGYIYYTKRDSLGNCIIPETMLPDPMHTSGGYTKVCVDNSDNVHIQWSEPSTTGKGIGYAKLNNSGAIVVTPHLAMPGYGGGSSCNRHEIAIDKYKNINVVWDESPMETNQISYTKLDSLGDTIIARIRVSPIGLYSIWPGIGADSSANNHMGYRTDTATMADRLTYSKLDSNGNILVSNKPLGIGLLPTIISDRTQNIHMVYLKPTPSRNDVCYLKLDNNGNILVPSKQLSLTQYIHNNSPHMAMDSLQYLHVVWDMDSAGTFPIMYTKLDTLGNFVIPPMQVVYPPYTPGGGGARIAVDLSNRLHLVWVDGRVNPGVTTDIFYKRGENEPGIEEIHETTYETTRLIVFPNPFKQATTIRYLILDSRYLIQHPKIYIYDATGCLVKSFNPESSQENQESEVLWDGRDYADKQRPAGVYFVQLRTKNYTEIKKVIMLE